VGGVNAFFYLPHGKWWRNTLLAPAISHMANGGAIPLGGSDEHSKKSSAEYQGDRA
jgi:hypothetical protein